MVEPIQNIHEDVIDGAPIKQGEIKAWHNKNRTLYGNLDGVSNQGIAWITARNKSTHPYRRTSEGKPDVASEELELYPFEVPDSSFSDIKKEMLKKIHICMMNFYKKVNQIIPGERYYREKACLDCMNKIEAIVEWASQHDEYDDLNQAGYIVSLMNVLLFRNDVNSCEKNFSHWLSKLGSIGLDSNSIASVIQARQAYKRDEFWDFIYRLTANGINVISDECLTYAFQESEEITSADISQCLQYISQLLTTHGQSVESIPMFMKWRKSVINASQQAQSIENEFLREKFLHLLNILRGDINCLQHSTATWYEMMGALVRYSDPSKEILSEHCQTALTYSNIKELNDWERAAIRLFKGEVLLAIQCLETIDFSLAAIIAELLDKYGIIDNIYGLADIETNNIFQWLMITHCQECIDQADTSLIISTLDFIECKLHDLFDEYEKNSEIDNEETIYSIKEYAAKIYGLIAEYISHMPIENNQTLEWAVKKSEQFASHEITLQLFGIYSRKLSDQGHYYEALTILDQSRDMIRMNNLCWSMFEQVIITGQPIGDESTMNMVKSGPTIFSPELRNCVSYFAVMTNLVIALETEQWQGAAELIMLLIRFPQMKPKYLTLLIMMTLPISQETSIPVFTRNDIVQLISTIDELQGPGLRKTLELGNQLVRQALDNPIRYRGDWRRYFDEKDDIEHILYVVRQGLGREFSQVLLR